MDQQQLSDRLEDRVADLPVGAPPLDAMRSAVRRRRSRLTVLGAAAVVVLVAGGLVIQAADTSPDPRPPVVADPPAEVDEPPAGHRYVGIGAAVVAVPDEWGTNETECGTPQEDTVIIDQGVICLALFPRPKNVDSVDVRPYYDGLDLDDWVERDVDGERVLWSPVSTEGGVVTASVYVPSQQVTFVAASSSAGAEEVVESLRGSVAILENHTTLPGFQLDGIVPRLERYRVELERLGLSIEVNEKSSQLDVGTVLATDPAVGSVVTPGDTVRVTVAR